MKKFALLPLFLLLLAGCKPVLEVETPPVVEEQFIHRYGMPVQREKWIDEGQNGQVISTTRDGVTIRQGYYLGALEGESTFSFPFSQEIEKRKTYSHNQLLKETTYYPTGNIKQETAYNPPDHTLVVKQWYENGTLRSEEKLSGNLLVHGDYFDPRGQKLSNIGEGSGQRSVRDTFGQLIFTEDVKDGKVDVRTNFYPDGTPKEVDPYVKGVVHGQRKTYYPGGEPKTIETWNNGQQSGLTTLFRDGERYQEFPYVNGYKQGIGRVYKDGATVVQEINYKADLQHGPTVTYIDGRKVVDWYFKGKKVTKGYYDSFNFRPTTIEDLGFSSQMSDPKK